MSSNILIGQFATGLWESLGSPTTISVQSISGYVVQPYTLGQLNTKIGTCYSSSGFLGTGTLFDITPSGIGNAELAIIGAMYTVSFYKQMASRTMGGGGSTIPFQRLREGDSDITRASITNIGKEYREMAKDANEQLNYLVNQYIQVIQSGGTPRDVAFLNPGYGTAYPYGLPGGIYWR